MLVEYGLIDSLFFLYVRGFVIREKFRVTVILLAWSSKLLLRPKFMRIVCLGLIFVFQGCALFPSERPVREGSKQLELPEMWYNSGAGTEGQISTGWLNTFDDPEMLALVFEALERNQGIRISEAQLKLAQEALVFGRSPLLPRFSFSRSASGSGTRVREEGGNLSPWRSSESHGLTVNASWEVDLWGRLRNLNRAAEYDYEAQKADFRGARLALAATTAKAWCNLIASKQQLALAHQTRESFERNFRITERNYKAGDSTASPLSVQFAGNNVASAKRSVISRQLALDEAKRALEILLGRYPATAIEARDELPRLAESVPSGLPSELLMRRPDLAAAANDLLASAERATASRKNLLPAINLSGSGRVNSERIADLFVDPTSIARSAAASLSQPVFQGGSLQAQVRQAMIRNELQLESFVSTALRAFREVESALARDLSLAAQEEFLEVELSQASLAETQANRDYSEGIVNIIQVLEAQRRAFNARNAAISLKNQRLQNRIDLHLALGGDFATQPEEFSDEVGE
ncbi:MAG: Outer membrane protein OprM [Verrucomicrobia subdivision 3 bacterium]|nr:Outer membrane protein OprM [Limisphaerales bacterium]MCS1415216.1 Outer membrane protein OprM [Limisphaerales bacterium]